MVYSDYTESIWRAILSTSQRSPYLFLYYNLFLLVVISRGIFANFEPKITYISYSRSIEVDESPVSIDLLPNRYSFFIRKQKLVVQRNLNIFDRSQCVLRTDFQILEEVDDSPFETYELPWPIQVFGRSLKYGFLSSNGALHLYNGIIRNFASLSSCPSFLISPYIKKMLSCRSTLSRLLWVYRLHIQYLVL